MIGEEPYYNFPMVRNSEQPAGTQRRNLCGSRKRLPDVWSASFGEIQFVVV
jgi:hypothetical protein